jgi:hypothetical protein
VAVCAVHSQGEVVMCWCKSFDEFCDCLHISIVAKLEQGADSSN